MASTNNTPLQLYYSLTATNTPTTGNLVYGELAINVADGKLYYKDTTGVQTLATKNTTAGIFPGNGSFGGTGQLLLPVGTTGQRATLPQAGFIRFNSTTNQFEGYSSLAGATISSITFATTTATVTTATAHGLTAGNVVTVVGATPAAYNGTFLVVSTPSPAATTFTYTMLSNPGANASPVGSYTSGYWGAIGGGGLVAGGAIVQNLQTVSISYAIPSGSSAMSTGPITIATGKSVTVPSGSKWVIL